MAYVYGFEKLIAWQMSRRFVKSLYLQTKEFPKEETFGITSQIRRASVSISCNLAEGSARLSDREQVRFYSIAYGSALEVMNLLILCLDLEYLAEGNYVELRTDLEKITYQINRLVRSQSNDSDNIKEPDFQYLLPNNSTPNQSI